MINQQALQESPTISKNGSRRTAVEGKHHDGWSVGAHAAPEKHPQLPGSQSAVNSLLMFSFQSFPRILQSGLGEAAEILIVLVLLCVWRSFAKPQLFTNTRLSLCDSQKKA